jgi:hypothetical protein
MTKSDNPSRRIILSRKGFDSSAGGKPSVVYKNRLYSFPIPEAESNVNYRDLQFIPGTSYMDLFHDLGIKMFTEAHLDPDIRSEIFLNKPRPKDWRGVFGQDDTAQGHLCEEGVTVGDIFLFFGWFKHLDYSKKHGFSYRREESRPDGFHAIWGVLEVGEKYNVETEFNKIPHWAKQHAHAMDKQRDRKFYSDKSTLYIASEKSSFGLNKTFGTFSFNKDLILSAGKNRSVWNLPDAFKGCKMSYHPKKIIKILYCPRKKIGEAEAAPFL